MVLKSKTFKTINSHLTDRRLYDWYNEETLLQGSYKRTDITFFTEKFSLIPEKYESETLKKTISNIFPAEKEDDYTENYIASLQAKLIYQVPTAIRKKLSDLFVDYQLIHPVQKLIPSTEPDCGKENILLFFDEKNMLLILRKKKEILFCNTFKVNHASDATYYTLTVLKQFGIPKENVSISLCGKAGYAEELSTQLSRYFSSIEKQYPLNVIGNGIDKKILSENLCLF